VLKPGMSAADIERLLQACDGPSFEMVRMRAFLQVMLATALRFHSVWSMSMSRLDVDKRRAWVLCKGGRTEPVDIDGKAMRDLKVYLGRRRVVAAPGEQAVWLTGDGGPLSYHGAHAMFTRLEALTGIKCNPHRFRHTVAQAAARAGAPVADIQDLLKHKSDVVSRMYIGEARQDVAAALGPKYSLAG
jgi:integrase/recombinase XerC